MLRIIGAVFCLLASLQIVYVLSFLSSFKRRWIPLRYMRKPTDVELVVMALRSLVGLEIDFNKF